MEIIKKKDLSINEIDHIREMIDYNNMISQLDLDIAIDNSFTYSDDIATNFLAYKSGKLVGYAHIFAPSSEAFEVQSMVLKDYERIRVNTKLLDYVKKEAAKFKPKELLLLCDESSKSGLNYIDKISGEYRHSEYLMKIASDYKPKFKTYSENLVFKKANLSDLDDYIGVSKKIYDSSITDLRERFERLFEKEDRSFYILYENNKPIGIGSIVLDNDKYMLYGFGISNDNRGKGYSNYFLNKIIEETMKVSADKIYLEVNSKNDIAHSLYMKNGFYKLKEISYFSIKY